MSDLNSNQKAAVEALTLLTKDAKYAIERDWRATVKRIAGRAQFRIDTLMAIGAVEMTTIRQGPHVIKAYRPIPPAAAA